MSETKNVTGDDDNWFRLAGVFAHTRLSTYAIKFIYIFNIIAYAPHYATRGHQLERKTDRTLLSSYAAVGVVVVGSVVVNTKGIKVIIYNVHV